MIAKILFVLFALPIAVMLYFTAKASADDRTDRVFPPSARYAVRFAAILAVGLLLMFAVGGTWGPWLAVAVVIAGAAVPFLIPLALITVAIVGSWITGKPIRWN